MRLFVALNLPAVVREAVWAAAAPLRALDLPVKWVRAEGLHLTIKFLGEVPDEREPDFAAALAQAGAGGSTGHSSRGIPLALGDWGSFPNPTRPRVVWLGVAPDPSLELLQHRVELAFAELGVPAEGRPFRPHVTLGRARQGGGRFAGLEPALASLTYAETVVVETVDLMRSTLERGGAVYHVRRSVPLV